jgi:hypothetical protein
MKPASWERIDEIYHATLARSPEERHAFLDEACREDIALRREVESLLARATDASGFLETNAMQLMGRALAELKNSKSSAGADAGVCAEAPDANTRTRSSGSATRMENLPTGSGCAMTGAHAPSHCRWRRNPHGRRRCRCRNA